MERCEDCTGLGLERDCMASGTCLFHTGEEQELETWVPVPGYDRMHHVSSTGRFRNMMCDRGRQVCVKVITPLMDGDRPVVFLNKPAKGVPRRTSRLLAEVVLEAFHGPAPDSDALVEYTDKNRGNVSPLNLRWRPS